MWASGTCRYGGRLRETRLLCHFPDMTVSKHVDVLIIGAGISGVDAVYRLKTRCPEKSLLILEARERVGGTWDLFRYPGVRSDSDIFTLGFPFRPWPSDQAIVDGPAIRQYVEDTARETGVFEQIRFGQKVIRAGWSSADSRWTVETEDGERFTAAFLYLASGYYDYDQGYRPSWPGEEAFEGRIVHPQFWPEELDFAGKRVAVIGSGATAVTLVPALAGEAAQVTMVQRSPSYIVARPGRDAIARRLQRLLPKRAAGGLIRWKNILLTIYFYGRARRRPERVSRWIREQVRKALPIGYPVERDFTPSYKPWDQRLCLVPDGDLFAAIAGGKVSVATGAIERFTRDGLRLATGEEVRADVVVTATGLVMKVGGGIELSVDSKPVELPERFIYKGMMLSGVPNLFISFGYVNASWTLRSDLTARSVCRLLQHMDKRGFATVVARADGGLERRPVIDFSSGYVQRAQDVLPSQGDRQPWQVPQNYLRDSLAMTFSRIDEALEFGAGPAAHA
ncbi:MAG TPA: NAD(P)/FAD-dependent oxidoreductase [Sphingomicrobium sp.]